MGMTTRARMAALVLALRDEAPLTLTDELAVRLETSKRSVWRDLQALVAVGVATYSRLHGYRLAAPGERPASAPPPPRKCVECSADAAPKRGRCERHLALLRQRPSTSRAERVRERYRRLRAAGLCIWCQQPAEITPRTGKPGIYCAAHRAQEVTADTARRKVRRMRRRLGLEE
jgi:biotin operon repressor